MVWIEKREAVWGPREVLQGEGNGVGLGAGKSQMMLSVCII